MRRLARAPEPEGVLSLQQETPRAGELRAQKRYLYP